MFVHRCDHVEAIAVVAIVVLVVVGSGGDVVVEKQRRCGVNNNDGGSIAVSVAIGAASADCSHVDATGIRRSCCPGAAQRELGAVRPPGGIIFVTVTVKHARRRVCRWNYRVGDRNTTATFAAANIRYRRLATRVD